MYHECPSQQHGRVAQPHQPHSLVQQDMHIWRYDCSTRRVCSTSCAGRKRDSKLTAFPATEHRRELMLAALATIATRQLHKAGTPPTHSPPGCPSIKQPLGPCELFPQTHTNQVSNRYLIMFTTQDCLGNISPCGRHPAATESRPCGCRWHQLCTSQVCKLIVDTEQWSKYIQGSKSSPCRRPPRPAATRSRPCGCRWRCRRGW